MKKDGIRPPKARIYALKNLKQPKELVRYIGMFGFYQQFILNYDEFVELLREVQRSPTFVWKEHHTKALENLKKSLVNATRLAFPNRRENMNITADASNIGIGACPNQIQNGESRLLGFFSRKLSEAERRTSKFEKSFWRSLRP